MDTLAQLQALDHETLTPLVRQALGSDSVMLVDWQVAPFGAGAGQCVYRFAGSAQEQGKTVPWSLIAKVATASTSVDDPSAGRYWKREMLASQSGLLADLPGGLAAPRCFGVTEQSGGGGWLWLEEITDAATGRWPRERFRAVARQLGVFGAAYVTGWPVPAYPWLSRGWFRSFVDWASNIAELPSLLDHPHLRPAVSGATGARILQLWNERDAFLHALDRLPQTFCHLDINPRNLFVRNGDNGDMQSIAIDWEYVGMSALGAELASLVGGSLFFDLADLDTADDLEAAVFASYLEGLTETGWRGDPQEVRLGYTIAQTLHILFLQVWVLVEGTRNEGLRQFAEQLLERPYTAVLERTVVFLEFLLARADEARQQIQSA